MNDKNDPGDGVPKGGSNKAPKSESDADPIAAAVARRGGFAPVTVLMFEKWRRGEGEPPDANWRAQLDRYEKLYADELRRQPYKPRLRRLRDIQHKQFPPTQWIIPGYLPLPGLALFVGDP